jgi:hypothetical protein
MIVSTCNLTMFFFLYYQLYSTRLDLPIQEIAVDNVTVSITFQLLQLLQDDNQCLSTVLFSYIICILGK